MSVIRYVDERKCWTPFYAASAPTDGASREQADNDQGANFLTMYLGEGRWAALWLRPLFEPTLSGGFAFHIVSNGAKHVSAPFVIAPNQPWPDQVHEESRAPTSATRMCP